jgi:hypothetical protein
MTAALILLLIQGTLGAFDTLFYHEWRTRLPHQKFAGTELRLHASRDFAYAIVFGSLGWVAWNGWLAWGFMGLLSVEIVITIRDFIEEDQTRKLPGGERMMHTVMGIIYGAFLGQFIPELLRWSERPAGFAPADYGVLSYLLSAFAVGVFSSGVRDWIASDRVEKLATT